MDASSRRVFLTSQAASTSAQVTAREEGLTLSKAISLEASLYAAASILAFLLRFPLLDARPLSVEEGALAMESYRLWQGDAPVSLAQGPFTAFATAVSLAMFGGDGAVRLLSAIAGSLVSIAPYLFRIQLGRAPALLAAFGLALSPLMVHASRTMGSGIVPLALSVALMWILSRGLGWPPTARAYSAAVVASALLATGRDGISVALALSVAAVLSADSSLETFRGVRRLARDPVWRRAAAIFVLSTLAIGTGFGSHLAGAQWAAVDVWGQWLSSFSLDAPRGPVVALLLLYELPVVVIGVAQLVRTVASRARVDTFLALWASSSMLVVMLQDAPHSSRLVLPMLPLYLLAARLVGGSLGILAHRGRGWGWNLAWVAVALPLVVGYVLLNRASNPGLDLPTPYLYGQMALVGVAGLSVAFLVRGRSRLALGWLVLAILSVGFLVHTTAFLNFRADTASSEPAIGAHPSKELRDAAKEASYYARYSGTQLAIDEGLYAIAGWYLRGDRAAAWSSHGPRVFSIELLGAGAAPAPSDGERRPGVFDPTVDPGRLSWEETWRWMVDRSALIDRGQRDIILRAPAGNW